MKTINYFIKRKTYAAWMMTAISLTGLIVGINSCEDRFTPVIDSRYNEVLVVDGSVNSGPGPYSVKLSYSSTIDQTKMNPASGFEVIIADDLGNRETLTETEPGNYLTTTGAIQGIPGRSYRLELRSSDGKKYLTDFEQLPQPVGIDSVYPEVEYASIDEYPFDLPGYRFYVDAEAAAQDSSYFMWQLEETYRYESDFKIYFSYYDRIVHPVKDKDTLKTCYKTNIVPGFYLVSTAGLSAPEITHFPLNYVTTDNRKLSVRYSLFVRQLTLTEAAYKFWKSTIEQSTPSGELFTKQFYQVHGNVYNPDDAEEIVFGYFTTAGLDKKRIFVDRPGPPLNMYYSICYLTKTDFENYGWMFLGPAPPASDPLYVTESAYGARALPGQACLNCMLKGGTTEKPDFWIDN